MTNCVYVLINPIDMKPFYVGKTNNPKSRLNSHIRDAKKMIQNINKCKLILDILEKGIKPILRIIEWCFNTDVVEREKYWIKYYRRIVKLVNKSEGGEIGNKSFGEINCTSVLDTSNVLRIVELYKYTNLTSIQIASLYKVSVGCIDAILKGRNWTHLTKGKVTEIFPKIFKNKNEWLDEYDCAIVKDLLCGVPKEKIHGKYVIGKKLLDEIYERSYAI